MRDRDGERIDLSVVDIVRTRRRGVPRYNAFRTGLHMAPVKRWEEMSADAETVGSCATSITTKLTRSTP